VRDLRSARAIHAKGGLFLLLGLLSSAALLAESPTVRTAALLGASVWAFARFYYYAFYVIEHYVDPGFRYSGLGSLVRYWVRRGRAR
jgi:hypothetical protein